MGLFNKLFKSDGKEMYSGRVPGEKNKIYAPVTGTFVALKDFPDEVFSSGMLGKGCGITPTEGIVWAPFDGVADALLDSKHALGLKSTDGVELSCRS